MDSNPFAVRLAPLLEVVPGDLLAHRPEVFSPLGEVDRALERALASDSELVVCGVDESGAGPLAGPLVAAACVLPRGFEHPLLRDSKLMTERQRSQLFDELSQDPEVSWSVAVASVERIDSDGIRPANLWAMTEAVRGAAPSGGVVLSDARDLELGPEYAVFPLVKGDRRSLAVAAASVLAKVTRDRIMCELDAKHPGYGFAAHKGYGTAAHREAIRRLGLSPVHREASGCRDPSPFGGLVAVQ